MVDTVDINTYVKKLAEEFKPERVVLFGSYARGTANEDSDVDLLVIMSHKGRNVDQALTRDRGGIRSAAVTVVALLA